MASSVINQWFIIYKPSIILQAITIAIMYLVLTIYVSSLHIMASLSGRLLGIPYSKTIKSISHENKQWALNRKAITFELQGIFTIPTY